MFQITIDHFKALIFLTVLGFSMIDRALANPLDKEGQTVPEPSHRKEDAQPINNTPLSSLGEEAISHQRQMKGMISHPRLKEATNEQQNQTWQVPHNADVSHEKDTRKNSYPEKK